MTIFYHDFKVQMGIMAQNLKEVAIKNRLDMHGIGLAAALGTAYFLKDSLPLQIIGAAVSYAGSIQAYSAVSNYWESRNIQRNTTNLFSPEESLRTKNAERFPARGALESPTVVHPQSSQAAASSTTSPARPIFPGNLPDSLMALQNAPVVQSEPGGLLPPPPRPAIPATLPLAPPPAASSTTPPARPIFPGNLPDSLTALQNAPVVQLQPDGLLPPPPRPAFPATLPLGPPPADAPPLLPAGFLPQPAPVVQLAPVPVVRPQATVSAISKLKKLFKRKKD